MKYFFTIITVLLLSAFSANGQDTLKTYNLDEVVVKSGIVVQPKSVTEIDYARIEKADAGNLSELAKYIPSVKLQTNSRGESLIYLRGSGKRQLLTFFDGVPLNVPWDNRIDLSLIPTDAIKEISVTRGIPSIVYGANTPAGVVNVQTREYSDSEEKNMQAVFGNNAYRKLSGYYLGGNNNISYLGSISYMDYDNYNLPDDFSSPENPGDSRINTYKTGYNVFGKLNYKYGGNENLEVSGSFIDSDKGVAPEIGVEKVRYWKYSDWRRYSLSINGTNHPGAGSNHILVYSVSYSNVNTQIDQYNSIAYEDIDEIEKGVDNTLYGRLIYTRLLGTSHIFKLSASGYHTVHDETIITPSEGNEESATYSQNVFSLGGEYELVGKNYTVTAGASFDGSANPEAGGKTPQDPFYDYGLVGAFTYTFDNNFSTRFNIGRKTRFAAPRELYSGALNKFVINPELKPESSWSGEASMDYNEQDMNAEVSLFYTVTTDGIVRTTLEDGRYKRINKDEIRTFGAEMATNYTVNKNLSANFNLTYVNSYAKNSEGEFADTLEYKPALVGGFMLDYRLPGNFDILAEVQYVAEEYGLQGGYEYFRKLPHYWLLSARGAYDLQLDDTSKLEIFIRVNNIFDKLYYTQWGLPEPGRELRVGLSADF